MHAKTLEELHVFQRALDAADAVSALLKRGDLARDLGLKHQLSEASSRIPSHIAEGFGQKTDRHFAHFLYIARGSCNEVRAHLSVAKGRGYITPLEWEAVCGRYIVLGKQLTKLVQHLRAEARQERG